MNYNVYWLGTELTGPLTWKETSRTKSTKTIYVPRLEGDHIVSQLIRSRVLGEDSYEVVFKNSGEIRINDSYGMPLIALVKETPCKSS